MMEYLASYFGKTTCDYKFNVILAKRSVLGLLIAGLYHEPFTKNLILPL